MFALVVEVFAFVVLVLVARIIILVLFVLFLVFIVRAMQSVAVSASPFSTMAVRAAASIEADTCSSDG